MTNSSKIKIGITGGAGYTGGELIRILLNHPNAEISFVHSKSNSGKPVSSVHTDLFGDTDLVFTSTLEQCDVLFLCMGHGESGKFLAENPIGDSTKIIDLSNDFRLSQNSKVKIQKGAERTFVYGLPEINRDTIKSASNIANPGCFATAIQLALIPLAKKGLLKNEVHISAITGSTGAGQSLSPTSHFSWRNNNVSVYKAFTHQHLGEINQSLKQLQSTFDKNVNFIPYRGNFTRGILASVYTEFAGSADEAVVLYRDYYKNHPFVYLSANSPDIKQVVNTNKCMLSVEKHDNKILIQSVIDNLVKGASGQAVQNMNLMFGLDESEGLKLKASAF